MLENRLKQLRYGIEALLAMLLLGFFRLLPLDVASALGGMIARILGRLFKAHRVAEKNLILAMPELSANQRKKILNGMWDNLGRVIGEYPHLGRSIMKERITVEGKEYLESLKTIRGGALFASCHFANWEITPLSAALYGLPLVLIYRAANNPYSDWIIQKIRGQYNKHMYKKGREGAMQMLKSLKAGDPVAILADQKLSDGKSLLFFGHEAKTTTAVTSLAIKMQAPVFLARVVRTDGVHFHVTLQAPIYYPKDADAGEAMQAINDQFEAWIREYPEQWFWVHKRWG